MDEKTILKLFKNLSQSESIEIENDLLNIIDDYTNNKSKRKTYMSDNAMNKVKKLNDICIEKKVPKIFSSKDKNSIFIEIDKYIIENLKKDEYYNKF